MSEQKAKLLISTDIDDYLLPISDESPAGSDVEYEPLFEQLSAARESDNNVPDDEEWGYQARVADWPKVSNLCLTLLEKYSKDLQVSCWLAQAQGELYGLPGIKGSLLLISRLMKTFWPSLYPQLEEGDEDAEIRMGRLNWLDKQLAEQLENIALTDDGKLSLRVWQRVQYFEQRVASHSSQRESLLSEGYFGSNVCTDSINATSPDFLRALLQEATQLQQTIEELHNTLTHLLPSAPYVLTDSAKKLQALIELGQRYLNVVAPGGRANEIASDDNNISASAQQKSGIGVRLAEDLAHSETRQVAIEQMLIIANYFRHNEPTSPVPFLMEKAARWANMDMTEWLEEILAENDASLRDIYRVIKSQPEENKD